MIRRPLIGIKLTEHQKRRTPKSLLAGGSSIRVYPDRDVKQGKNIKNRDNQMCFSLPTIVMGAYMTGYKDDKLSLCSLLCRTSLIYEKLQRNLFN